MTDTMTDDDATRLPTDQDMNAATLWICSQVYERPDVTMRLLDDLARTGRLPLLWSIAKMLDTSLEDLWEKFAAEILRRTGIPIAPVGLVKMPTPEDAVH